VLLFSSYQRQEIFDVADDNAFDVAQVNAFEIMKWKPKERFFEIVERENE
jgi:hypothetical protein